MDELSNVKKYWDTLSSSLPIDLKDHWIDADGSPLSTSMFFEIASYIESNLKKNEISKHVLEVGCGTGRILEELYKIDNNIALSGIDFSEKQIDEAKNKSTKINYFVGDIFDYCSSNHGKKFDLIFLHSVTQYFPNEHYFDNF